MNLLYIQLITSFLVGGGVITFISFLVERIDKKYSGLILGSPTTLVLGLFFLGMAVGSDKVVETIPAIFFPLGFSIFFSIVYLYTAIFINKFRWSKLTEIALTYAISIVFWLLLITPIVIYKFSNLLVSITGCLMIIGLTQYIFVSFPQNNARPQLIKYTFRQKIGRGIFIGFIIASIVFLGKTVGSFWGGVFSVFPAAFSSTLPIFHWYNKPRDLYPLMKTIPYGALSVFAYLLSCIFTFTTFGYGWGTLISYGISLLFLVMISGINNKL